MTTTITTTVLVPPGASSQPLTFTVGLTASQPISSAFGFVGQTFFIEAHAGDGGSVVEFAHALTITIRYTDADVVGLDESTLTLNYWEVNAREWEPVPTIVYPDTNTLVARVEHLTTFAVIGQKQYWLYLPLVRR